MYLYDIKTRAPHIEFEDAPEELSFKEFSFDNYLEHEKIILRPQLVAMGYVNISFRDGDRDSFGPLTRVICCQLDGVSHHFVYG